MSRSQPWATVVENYVCKVSANIATSVGLSVAGFAKGSLIGASAGTITFYGSKTQDGTYYLIENSGSTDLSVTKTADRCTAIPEEAFLVPFLKIIAGSEVTLDVFLQSE